MPSSEHQLTAATPVAILNGARRMQYHPKRTLVKAKASNTDNVLLDTVANGDFAFTLGPGDVIGWNLSGSDVLWAKAASGTQLAETIESA